MLTTFQRNGLLRQSKLLGKQNCKLQWTLGKYVVKSELAAKGVPGKIFLLYYETACIDFQIKHFLLVETDKQVMIKVVF